MQELRNIFQQKFHRPAEAAASAPGRLEILGNHTDYNEGVVLSCAVTQRTAVALAANQSSSVNLYDARSNEYCSFDITKLHEKISPRWGAYPAGVISELQKRSLTIAGFDGVINSSVPLSAGMSSSAAFEMAVLFALMKLFQLDIAPAEAARIGQGVENNFMGLQSGLLDQFSSIFGVKDAFILSDFRTVEVVETAVMAPEASILVVNSMEKHNLVDSEYNQRRQACESAAAKLAARHVGVKTLRDVSSELLHSEKAILSDLEYRRALHVVSECERVRKAIELLKKNDLKAFGQLWWDSHESSRINFENSTPALDKIVELSHTLPGALGARLSGGGFGGITIHLVENSCIAAYREEISRRYCEYCKRMPETIICQPGAGAC